MSRSFSKGKSGIGAIVKVHLPKFNFKHLQRQSQFVEEALQTQLFAQEVDARELTQSIINQKRKVEVEQIQAEKLNNFHQLREKLSSGQGLFTKRVVLKTQNSKRIGTQNRTRNTNTSHTIDTNKRGQNTLSLVQQPYGIDDSMYQPQQLDWIEALNKRAIKSGVDKPARNPIKIESFLNRSQAMPNVPKTQPYKLVQTTMLDHSTATQNIGENDRYLRIPDREQVLTHQVQRPDKQRQYSILSQDDISRRRDKNSILSKLSQQDQIQQDQSSEVHNQFEEEDGDFANQGLNTNKTLKNYDCWDDAKTPYELINQFSNDIGYHAKCPLYTKDKKYTWTPVQVIGYNATQEKYQVRLTDNGSIKYVGRLSLMFKNENEKDFKTRLYQCKQLQKQAEDELRFCRYVMSIDDDITTNLPESQQTNIIQCSKNQHRRQGKKRSPHVLDSQTINNNNEQDHQKNTHQKKLMDQLISQVQHEYKLFMKKFYVLKEMEDQTNQRRFHDLRIQPRYIFDILMKITPKRNVIKENFKEIKNILETIPQLAKKQNITLFIPKRDVTESLFNLTNKAARSEVFKLFQTEYQQGQLPLTLDQFEDQMKKSHVLFKQNMFTQWRSFLIQETQDILRNVYSFYQTESNQYNMSELSRLLKKLDFMFCQYTVEHLLLNNIKIWVKFVRQFIHPDEHSNNPWKVSEVPIIIINLCVNLNRKKKVTKKNEKEKDKKGKNKSQEVLDQAGKEIEDDAIYFEPSKQKVKEALINPLCNIIETMQNLSGLEKDLVPLVDLKPKIVIEVDMEYPQLAAAKADIESYIEYGYQGPQEVLESFRQFSYLFEKSQSHLMKSLFGDPKDKPLITNLEIEEISRKVQDYQRAKYEIEKISIDDKFFTFFVVKTKQAKESLTMKSTEILNQILQRTGEIVTDNISRITQNYTEMYNRMLSQPKNEIELVELKNFIAETEINIAKIKSEEIRIALIEGQRNVNIQETKFTEKLDIEKEVFAGELVELQMELKIVALFDNYKAVKENATEIMALKDRLERGQEKVRSFNDREILFKQAQSEYEDLNKVLSQFEPYHKLWDIAMEFDLDKQDWYQGPFLRLSFPPVERKVVQYYMKEILRLQKLFQDIDDDCASKVVRDLRLDVEKFREKMWIVELLTSEAIQKKPQTWKEIFKECEINDIESNDEMTLQVLIDAGMQSFREKIEEISKRTEKQWGIEKKLNELIERLREAKLEFMGYGNTGTSVLKMVDELQQSLDEQLNMLLMLKSSPFIKAVLNKANAVEQKIILIQDTLEGWIKTQRGWMYLEPIFSSDDIRKKLPSEKQKFDNVDKSFRVTIEQFLKDPFLWEGIDSDKYKLEFEYSNKLLDEIQKSLSEYLETKRRFFPRFFFLSDEELLEILAQTKDPLTVQKHINKCFEAINQLFFQEGPMDQDNKKHLEMVTAMISPEKEIVKFIRPINVNEGEKRGNVERWLNEIESVMIETLKRITLDSIQDNEIPRPNWIQKWPGQCVLGVSKLLWTQQVEQAMMVQSDQGSMQESDQMIFPSLKHLDEYLVKQLLDETVPMLYKQDMDTLTRIKVNSLIVLDVHSRNIVQELSKKESLTPYSFDWLAQLRYYWVTDKKGIGSLKVKMVNAEFPYGFEYLGNSGRLVITPLTDRCYRTLMGAFLLNYGGAPEGPAGTGKTETVKDLAKALAVQCVVFNCSDGLNYLAMSKFFKGLASSGAWCCFDEFNRIDLEVLSVIAQQVLTIQGAIKDKKKIFFFDTAEYNLIASCSINITMNPGYAGRSELPDNLKALFRPCAMMVPDYKLISGIYLLSVGFRQSQHLAVKIVGCLQLSSEQLSSQDHYDFGMRALKAMLTAAGNLKKQYPETNEEILCLRALMDVNIPKFTQNDIPLFLSITSDLFPMVKLPESDNNLLITALKQQCSIIKIQPVPNFLNKCIQLFDTINVRHGLMCVGQSFSGKSKVLECLQKTMSSLTGQQGFVPVVISKLNPKAVTSDQLYGKLDPDTKSWSDGVIAIIMRECSRDQESKERKWIVFDGPVDAVWIENMNTVLDDNKKLCLTSGEIIKMTTLMTMMFEVADLAVASPATVSRCGMVYMEPDGLGWKVLIDSFVQTWQETALEKYIDFCQKKISWLIDSSLAWIKRHGGPQPFPIYKSEMSLVKNTLQFMKSFTEEHQQEGVKLQKELDDQLGNLCLFSVIWGIGGALYESIRKPFNDLLQRMITASADIPEQYNLDLLFQYEPQSIYVKFHETLQKEKEKPSLFDLLYDKNKNLWVPWTMTQPAFIIPSMVSYSELIIPTNDLIRNNFFLHLCVRQRMHLLIAGPTGTGKTINIVNEINKYYFNKDYTNLQTAFSGQTTVNQVQRTIETKINSRRRKGYFGPEEGKKCCVLFIDDLNMPIKERFGAQPPIELLRQWMDTSGWYDLETKEFKYLQDMVFITAMLPPQGGRNVVTLRYLRHFVLLYAQPFENDSLTRIFGTVVEWFILNLGNQQNISRGIISTANQLVQCTIDLYNKLQNTKEMLPTPSKSHYVYNLRDISKVFQGVSKGDLRGIKGESDLIKQYFLQQKERLWSHECQRVFQDRLINIGDQKIFEGLLKEIIQTQLKTNWIDLVGGDSILFASFVPCIYPDGDTTRKPLVDVYCQILDKGQLKKICEDQLEENNNFFPHNKMQLVLFMSAIEHIIKIVRVLQTEYGHLLLVGVGGSGRKSLAQLSSFIAIQNEIYQVDQRQWIEELQKLLRVVGVDGKKTAFTFLDSQILNENMIEQICNLLNNGEVPNLYPADEKAKLIEDLTQFITQGTSQEKYLEFIRRCRINLHIILCMSPVGETFRARLRTFPALVNCTTIDWFLSWPSEALQSTAELFMTKQMTILKPENDENYQQSVVLLQSLVSIAVDMQERVTLLSQRYYSELRQYYYVTPTSYLELLNTFRKLVDDRRKSISDNITRYINGVEKILSTEKDVSKMKKVLEDLQPKLERATVENSHMLINLQKKQKEADGKKQLCEIEEKDCNIKREEANQLRDDCQQELDKVLPLLAAAAEALDKITKDDMVQLKSFITPPPAASIVMEGVCYTFNEDQNVKWKVKEAGSLEKVQDFWDYAKKNLLNDKLIRRVKDFKEDQIRSIPQSKINKLKLFVQNPMFEREKVFNASKAAGNLALWIRAVIDTYEALLVVDPKRGQLKVAEQNLREAEAILAEKKAALQEVLDFLSKLEQDYSRAKKEKEELENDVNKCKIQLDRAEKLIQGLGGEKDSWKKKASEYEGETKHIIGDCMISSGIIAYLGAFPLTYRDTTIQAWKDLLNQLQVQFSKDFSLARILSDPITIGQWTNQQKLPNDQFSIDNAIILKNSNRWPLMIDPQTQANYWIKIMENYQPPLSEKERKQQQKSNQEDQVAKKRLIVFKTTQPSSEVMMILENAISLGYSVLLEGLGEEINTIYNPLLQKKLVKQGSQILLKFGEHLLDYNPDFRFYMTTKLGRPHYSPEICVQVAILNFQVTQEGLEDQMLNIVVKQEEPVKEEQRQKNIKDFYENKNKQKQTEDLILKLLNESQGNLLEDEVLIETLQKSKIESIEIEEKLRKQEHDREVFNNIRNSYLEVAKRVSQVYFVVLDLAMIEPIYQWSLEFYILLFERSIRESTPGKEHRCLNIIDKFQQLLYDSICRSLLEKDKLIFSFLFQLKILQVEGSINLIEVRFMMVGNSHTEATKPHPDEKHQSWLTNKLWCGICEISEQLEAFKDLAQGVEENIDQWQLLVENDDPQLLPLPGIWDQKLNAFQKLIILRILRPDKVTPGIQKLISNNMGNYFIDPPPFNLEASYNQSDASTPLIFILSPGADPRLEILQLTEKLLGQKNNLVQLSLGQGQGAAAEKAIIQCVEEGKWVLLQNCHLAKSFMPELERIFESVIAPLQSEEPFRLWLTTAPSNVFPVSLLQRGIKLTFEPPRGIRNNLLRVYLAQDPKKFDDVQKPFEYKKLLFGLAFFHALLLERRKYGPLGWNIPYEFTQADFAISQSQLKLFLDDYETIPWDALNYLVAETNYGGRVTDPKDRRLIKIILKDFYDPQILLESYRFSLSGTYYAPADGSLQQYIEFIKEMSINDPTEVFGLHSNAEITSAILETNAICGTILSLLPRTSGPKGKSTEDTIKDMSLEILQQLPPEFDLETIAKKHPVEYDNSMNTVLQQELIRFNKLRQLIKDSLENVVKAIEGLVVMSTELEQVGLSVFDNIVPELWQKVSYPSLKPLYSYINDFVARLKYMRRWADFYAPAQFWISGFFFTQSFLTGVSQNYARKHHIPIDTLTFRYEFRKFSEVFDIPPEDGCYIYGLYLDGARWDDKSHSLKEADPYVLFYPVPTILLLPTQDEYDSENDFSVYECPVYKTSKRAGTLLTTGHSTNYVLSILTPIREHPNYWIKHGLAMLTQLND